MNTQNTTLDTDKPSAVETLLDNFEQAIKKEGTKRYLIKLGLLTVAYVASAKFGLSLGSNYDQITTVWPPTGIAIAALLLWGYHYSPAVFVGAFIANILESSLPAVAATIAIGNSLEAIVAVILIERYIGRDILEKISSIVAFVVLVAFLSPVISATIGTVTLLTSGTLTNSQLPNAWLTWWVGDMMGALIIVPLVVAWHKREYRASLSHSLYEGIALLLLVVITCLIIFSQPASASQELLTLTYLVFPIIILTAIRFTQIGAVTTGAVITTAAIWSTLTNHGPYVNDGSPESGLFVLNFFILVVMLTSLVLSVAVYGRLKSELTLIKKARELEQAQQQIMKNVVLRKDLQHQMKDAQDRINNILVGIFESGKPSKTKEPPN